jgi:hypothetical protein
MCLEVITRIDPTAEQLNAISDKIPNIVQNASKVIDVDFGPAQVSKQQIAR